VRASAVDDGQQENTVIEPGEHVALSPLSDQNARAKVHANPGRNLREIFMSYYAVALIAIWRSVSEVFDVSAESDERWGGGAVFCEER
jgi:hypothetical protein